MTANNAPNVWTQMNYVPPRGQCNFKQSIVSPKCPCLRFMLHPLKSSSSYECDGCAHHASFHSMENPVEDEIRKRWEQEAREKTERERLEQGAARPRKRLREIGYGHKDGDVGASHVRGIEGGMATPDEMDIVSEAGSCRSNTKGRTRKKATTTRVAVRGARSKGRITEILEDDAEYIELDGGCAGMR